MNAAILAAGVSWLGTVANANHSYYYLPQRGPAHFLPGQTLMRHTAMSFAPAPTDALPREARWAMSALVAMVHVAGAWALLQVEPVRTADRDAAPMFIDLIAPPAQEMVAPLPAPAPPAPAKRTPVERPVIASPAPVVAPTEHAVPPPPAAPAPAEVAAAVDRAASTPTDAGPAATATAPVPAEPRTVAISAVAYRTPPVLVYPPASRRAQEDGRVHVRVLVGVDGSPRDIEIIRSSGHPRLDESAVATVRATRFRPYTENGVAMAFRVVMPLVFELDN